MANYKIETLQGYASVIFLNAATINKFVGKEKRLLCTINTQEIHCAIMNSKVFGYHIMLGKSTLKKLGVKIGEIVAATFSKDNSVLQFEQNKILQEVLDLDDEANKIFITLTDGNKRGLINLVNMKKSEQKKIDRALLIAEKIKMGISQQMKM